MQYDTNDLHRVAAEAICDPRTVKRYLDGVRVASLSARRIKKALTDLGMLELSKDASGAA